MYILTMLYVLFTYYNRANEIVLAVITRPIMSFIEPFLISAIFRRTTEWRRPFTMFPGIPLAFVFAKPS